MSGSVLIVSHVFPPMAAGGAVRLGQFARYLPRFGWSPTVLTSEVPASAQVDTAALRALDPCVQILRAPDPLQAVAPRGATHVGTGAKGALRGALKAVARWSLFPDRQLPWVPGAMVAGHKALRARRHDVVFASYGPASNLIVGAALADEFALPLVVDFRDLWSDLPRPVFASPAHRQMASWLERRIVRRASRVTAVSEGMAKHLERRHAGDDGSAAGKFVAIPNGYDPDDVARAIDGRGGEPRPFNLLDTGSSHEHYDLGPFWRALRELRDAGRISAESFRVSFVGAMPVDDARSYGVSELVEVHPFVPHAEVFNHLARADAMLMLETPGYYRQMGSAVKVFDYLLTGKPVLALIEEGGPSARLLNAAGTGYIADPRNADQIGEVLGNLLGEKGLPPRAVVLSRSPIAEYDRVALTRALAVVLAAAHGQAT
ncbi:MAG: glycosyltransferase [Deltaproteobacteria bacterium]|nr:glycosyltransferase [Deltaproteobacteria bacterium]